MRGCQPAASSAPAGGQGSLCSAQPAAALPAWQQPAAGGFWANGSAPHAAGFNLGPIAAAAGDGTGSNPRVPSNGNANGLRQQQQQPPPCGEFWSNENLAPQPTLMLPHPPMSVNQPHGPATSWGMQQQQRPAGGHHQRAPGDGPAGGPQPFRGDPKGGAFPKAAPLLSGSLMHQSQREERAAASCSVGHLPLQDVSATWNGQQPEWNAAQPSSELQTGRQLQQQLAPNSWQQQQQPQQRQPPPTGLATASALCSAKGGVGNATLVLPPQPEVALAAAAINASARHDVRVAAPRATAASVLFGPTGSLGSCRGPAAARTASGGSSGCVVPSLPSFGAQQSTVSPPQRPPVVSGPSTATVVATSERQSGAGLVAPSRDGHALMMRQAPPPVAPLQSGMGPAAPYGDGHALMMRKAPPPVAPLQLLPLKRANGLLPPPAPHPTEATGGNSSSSWEALQQEMLVIDDVGRAGDFLSGRYEPVGSTPRPQQQHIHAAAPTSAVGEGSPMPIDRNTARWVAGGGECVLASVYQPSDPHLRGLFPLPSLRTLIPCAYTISLSHAPTLVLHCCAAGGGCTPRTWPSGNIR